MIRRLRRRRAELELLRVDAEVARWLVDDGTLSLSPLDGKRTATRCELRVARLEAVRALEAAGGRDPWPTVLREPTEAQRAARVGPRLTLPPVISCPGCGERVWDQDGFGVLYHEECGYCAHPSITGGVCDACGGIP